MFVSHNQTLMWTLNHATYCPFFCFSRILCKDPTCPFFLNKNLYHAIINFPTICLAFIQHQFRRPPLSAYLGTYFMHHSPLSSSFLSVSRIHLAQRGQPGMSCSIFVSLPPPQNTHTEESTSWMIFFSLSFYFSFSLSFYFSFSEIP